MREALQCRKPWPSEPCASTLIRRWSDRPQTERSCKCHIEGRGGGRRCRANPDPRRPLIWGPTRGLSFGRPLKISIAVSTATPATRGNTGGQHAHSRKMWNWSRSPRRHPCRFGPDSLRNPLTMSWELLERTPAPPRASPPPNSPSPVHGQRKARLRDSLRSRSQPLQYHHQRLAIRLHRHVLGFPEGRIGRLCHHRPLSGRRLGGRYTGPKCGGSDGV